MGMIEDIEHMKLYLGITIPCSLSQAENPSKFGEIHGDAMPFHSAPLSPQKLGPTTWPGRGQHDQPLGPWEWFIYSYNNGDWGMVYDCNHITSVYL